MKFEDLKDAVSGETILVDTFGIERYFIGFSPLGRLLTMLYEGRRFEEWHERSIKDWTEGSIDYWKIKKETKKYWLWDYEDEDRNWYRTAHYINDEYISIKGDLYCPLKIAKNKRKVESSLLEI